MRLFVRTLPIVISVAFVTLSPSIVRAQEPTVGSAPADDDVTPPTLKDHPLPVYPAAALRDHVEANVGIEVQIDEDGKVTSAKVTQPAGHGFDEVALDVIKEWTFAPATRGGRPTKSVLQLSFPFQLPADANAPAATPTPSVAQPLGTPPQLQQGADQSTLVLAHRPTPPPLAASDSTTGQKELSLLPRYRLENTLEAVPGLFSVQHSGGGKSQQYFLRGFDADHGTDIAFSIDGAPINMVSHGHGQGFSDLHFIIPETIESIDGTKGPYSVRAGDFATAGAVDFRMADHAEENYAKAEVGPWGHTRLVAIESPKLGPDWKMLAAAEVFHDNGPFIHGDDFNRFNGYLKTTHVLDDRSDLSLLLTAYGGSWNASGVLPARAVCGEGDGTPTPSAYQSSHCLSRWDSLDLSQGGDTQRIEGVATYRRRFATDTDLEAMVFVIRYGFQLFPNDGIAAPFQPDGIQYGSEVEQDDSRTELGTRVQLTNKTKLAGIDMKSTYGLQIRSDGIHSELHRDESRQRLDGIDANIPGPIVDSNIDETAIGFYASEDFRPVKCVRFVVGARADRIDATVSNESPVAVDKVSGIRGQAQFSPKGAMVVSPVKHFDLFANYGRGFHSNDARTDFSRGPLTLMSTVTGYEVGTVVRPIENLSLAAVAFLIDVQAELTIDGDDASTNATGPTRRYGGEFTGRYNFNDEIYADAALTVTHARYTDQADVQAGQAFVSLAPIRTFAAGIGARHPVSEHWTLFGTVHMRAMSDRYATQDGSLIATGFTMYDAGIGARYRFLELGADMLNIANVAWREGQFAVQSRLPGEGANPPVGISFTPGIPRTVLAHASLFW